MPEKKRLTRYIIGVIAVVLIGLGVWAYMQVGTQTNRLVGGETIDSWSFRGVYTGNTELEQKARDSIQDLESHMGKGPETDYTYYVSIANQYGLLGDGKSEYKYLNKALAIDDARTGLAWSNLGVLFERLGATQSAREAYKHAANAQASPQYVGMYLEFISEHFPEEVAEFENAYDVAKQVIGESPDMLQIRARWLEQIGRIDEAIESWKAVKAMSPGVSTAVDIEIQRLQSRL